MSFLHTIINAAIKSGKRVYDPQNPPDYAALRAAEVRQNRNIAVPKTVTIISAFLGNVPVEHLRCAPNPSDRILFYLHGGGFVGGSAQTRRAFTGYLADRMGYNVVAANYRLAPEHPFPAAPEDCFAVYRELLRMYPPGKVILVGESAGANLVLATLLQIKAAELPQPAAAVCIAPCVQFDQVFPSHCKNAKTDAIVANLSEEVRDVYLQSRNASLIRNPLFAPYYGDFRGCAPIYLWASTEEVLLDDSVKLYEKLVRTHHPCNLYLRSGMMHTWMIIPYFSEAKKDLLRMKKHLDLAFSGNFVPESGMVYLN